MAQGHLTGRPGHLLGLQVTGKQVLVHLGIMKKVAFLPSGEFTLKTGIGKAPDPLKV